MTAHQLNATSDYPPYKRTLTVHYDYPARRARFDYDPVPHMPPKSFVRRYDLGMEWMVMEVRSAKECQKSMLREALPFPRFPENFIFIGRAHVRGKLCDHWREDHGEETVEYFETSDGHIPLRITTEAVQATSPERITTPLMTYDFSRFERGPPPEELFRMKSSSTSASACRAAPPPPPPPPPPPHHTHIVHSLLCPHAQLRHRCVPYMPGAVFASDTTLEIGQCERVVQDMGFPYIHFMHTYMYA